jgi:hypothetical protein
MKREEALDILGLEVKSERRECIPVRTFDRQIDSHISCRHGSKWLMTHISWVLYFLLGSS